MTRNRYYSRRSVLRTGATASALGLVGLSTVPGGVGAQGCDHVVDASGSGAYTRIQNAVDAASTGQTICVRAGTYEESVSVDVGVTLTGESAPDGPDAAVVDGSVTVSADDATVSNLQVAPSTTFVADGLDPHGILVSGATSGVTVAGNVVAGMTADSTGGSVTINGIQLWNDGPQSQTGTVVADNMVRDLHNQGGVDWPNYGGAAAIKVQGVLEDSEVTGNTIERVHSAGWTYGIVTTHTEDAPGISPTGTTVRYNTIEEVNDGSVYDVFDESAAAPYPGSAFAIDGDSDADEATATFNNFLSTPIGVQNKDDSAAVAATCNYWGHATGPAIDGEQPQKGASILGDVEYRPWSPRQIGHGRHPERSCVGGKRGSGGPPSNGP